MPSKPYYEVTVRSIVKKKRMQNMRVLPFTISLFQISHLFDCQAPLWIRTALYCTTLSTEYYLTVVREFACHNDL